MCKLTRRSPNAVARHRLNHKSAGQHPGLPMPAFPPSVWLVKVTGGPPPPQGSRGGGRIPNRSIPNRWPCPTPTAVRERTRHPRWRGMEHAWEPQGCAARPSKNNEVSRRRRRRRRRRRSYPCDQSRTHERVQTDEPKYKRRRASPT